MVFCPRFTPPGTPPSGPVRIVPPLPSRDPRRRRCLRRRPAWVFSASCRRMRFRSEVAALWAIRDGPRSELILPAPPPGLSNISASAAEGWAVTLWPPGDWRIAESVPKFPPPGTSLGGRRLRDGISPPSLRSPPNAPPNALPISRLSSLLAGSRFVRVAQGVESEYFPADRRMRRARGFEQGGDSLGSPWLFVDSPESAAVPRPRGPVPPVG